MKKAKSLISVALLLLTVSFSRAQVTTFSYTGNNFQTFTAPASGWYFIDVNGAQGGASSNYRHVGGRGARVQGYVQLQSGDVLRILVGGSGGTGSSAGNNISGGGGGGASSVVKVNGNSYKPLIFAGGGGGGAANYNGNPGTTNTNGDFPWGGANGYGAGVGYDAYGGAGGAGYYTDGGTHYNGSNILSYGGLAYFSVSSGYSVQNNGGDGGWGGGGEGGPAVSGLFNNSDGGGGGGGGWSGGGGGGNPGDGGGGGGSFVDTTVNTFNSLAITGGATGVNGIVSITPIQPAGYGFHFIGNVFYNYTVPASGWYFLDASGAQGGLASNGSHQGGRGARMQGYVFLQAGDNLRIAVGGIGGTGGTSPSGLLNGTNISGGGGGGASSLVKVNGSSYTPLVIAAGGGGGAANFDGSPGLSTSNGDFSWGGVNGNGGGIAANSSYYGGSAGGGFFTDGGSHYDSRTNTDPWMVSQGGQAYLSGNYGGYVDLYSGAGASVGGSGGWGSGGQGGAKEEANSHDGGGGGGGGWSGGGGGFDEGDGGGGGGSYSVAQCGISNITGANNGNGKVTIAGPHVAVDTVNTPGPTYTWPVNGFNYQYSGTYYYADSANCIMRVLDLSIGGLGGCLNYSRIDTTIESCGSYTSPLNGRTYTENTTDSFRVGCIKYVVRLIVALPAVLPGNMIAGSTVSSGSLAVCKNTSQTYTVLPVPYATSYQWTLPSGATGTSSTNSITVQFSNSFSGGNICVTPVNACGSGTPICRAITVLNTPPTGRLQIIGPAEPFISGIYSVSPIPGATTYTWSVSNSQAVIVSGQGTPNIQLEAKPGFTRTNLSVRASNCKGNGSSGTIALKAMRTPSYKPRVAEKNTQDISLYPNPSNGLFTLNTASLETDAALEVYSTDGRLVHSQIIPAHTTQILIDLHQPAAGLYQVRLVVGDQVSSVKLIVN